MQFMGRPSIRRIAGLLTATALSTVALRGEVPRVARAEPPSTATDREAPQHKSTLPPPRTHYMGRQIAPTMGYQGAAWLTRSTREREEQSQKLLDALPLKAGQVVCDVGCGNGYYTLRLARRVGPTGRVLALDIQPEMLSLLNARAKKENVQNIVPVLGSVADPHLPRGKIDLLLLVDVYHEFSYPERMLRGLRASLKPEGRLVLVEFRGEDPAVPIKPLHKMTKKQILKELPANGFRLVDEYDELPWQHVMIFGLAPLDESSPP